MSFEEKIAFFGSIVHVGTDVFVLIGAMGECERNYETHAALLTINRFPRFGFTWVLIRNLMFMELVDDVQKIMCSKLSVMIACT